MHGDAVLQHFSVSETALLGSGGESKVYAMDEEHVLRVYNAGIDSAYVKRLGEFYAHLNTHELPFDIPTMVDVADLDGTLHAIEKRLVGESMTRYLLTAAGEARSRSLRSYVAAAGRILELPIEAMEFGELLTSAPIRRPDWPAFLLARAKQTLRVSYAQLSADVAGLDGIVTSWEHALARLNDVATGTLVHGDYFPGNVLVDERGEVSAVIDFSPMTVAGDPRLDVACALIFLELDDGYQPSDSDIVSAAIADSQGRALLDLTDVYRTFYSFYFSFCSDNDPPLYDWCVANLTQARQRRRE